MRLRRESTDYCASLTDWEQGQFLPAAASGAIATVTAGLLRYGRQTVRTAIADVNVCGDVRLVRPPPRTNIIRATFDAYNAEQLRAWPLTALAR